MLATQTEHIDIAIILSVFHTYGHGIVCTPPNWCVHLGRNDDVLPTPIVFLQGLAQNLFRYTIRVYVGGIEEIQLLLIAVIEDGEGFVLGYRPLPSSFLVAIRHASNANARHTQACLA